MKSRESFATTLVAALGASCALAQHVIPPQFAGRIEGRDATPSKPRRAIDAALVWLVKHQDADGRWDTDEFMKHDSGERRCGGPGRPVHDIGITALATMALLADGHDTKRGAYRDNVTRAFAWLESQTGNAAMKSKHGPEWLTKAPITEAPGCFGDASHNEYFYSHVLATIALLEGYALTGDSGLRATAAAGVSYIKRCKNPASVWRYSPPQKDRTADDNDTSVTGWAIVALSTARACGFEVERVYFNHTAAWIDAMTDRSSGRTGYIGRGGGSARISADHAAEFPRDKSEVCTAIASFASYSMGETRATMPVLDKQAALISSTPPNWNIRDGSIDFYYWYHGTNALRQRAGTPWLKWRKRLHAAVLNTQVKRGPGTGSWDPVGAWSQSGGRVYSTAMLALCLQAEYRYPEFATLTPFSDAPAFKPVRTMWIKGLYGRVRKSLLSMKVEQLTKSERAERTAALVELDGKIETASERVDQLVQEPDYLAAQEQLERLEERYRGLGPATRAATILQNFRRDALVRAEIKASKKLRNVMGRFSIFDKKIHGRLAKELRAIITTYPDTLATRRARSTLKQLQAD